jgi:putative sporulation protein YtxC
VGDLLLKSIVYNGENEEIINGLEYIKHNLEIKGVKLGISESIENKTHFVKVFCGDDKFNSKNEHNFNLYLSMVIYKIMAKEFYDKKLVAFLQERYFFLKAEEITDLKKICINSFICEGKIEGENEVFYINRKNSATRKILQCVIENPIINVEGFTRFRIKEMEEDFQAIVDKVVEKYMVDKEYDEFIDLLKYFVDIQESKIEEVNIFAKSDGKYIIKDNMGKDISDEMVKELKNTKYKDTVNEEDIIISGLITLSPQKIVIHNVVDFGTRELIDTIVNVFGDKVKFYDHDDEIGDLEEKLEKINKDLIKV